MPCSCSNPCLGFLWMRSLIPVMTLLGFGRSGCFFLSIVARKLARTACRGLSLPQRADLLSCCAKYLRCLALHSPLCSADRPMRVFPAILASPLDSGVTGPLCAQVADHTFTHDAGIIFLQSMALDEQTFRLHKNPVVFYIIFQRTMSSESASYIAN